MDLGKPKHSPLKFVFVISSETKPCASTDKCLDSHAVCYIDPLFPVNAICRCDIRDGFKRSKDGTRCVGECKARLVDSFVTCKTILCS